VCLRTVDGVKRIIHGINRYQMQDDCQQAEQRLLFVVREPDRFQGGLHVFERPLVVDRLDVVRAPRI